MTTINQSTCLVDQYHYSSNHLSKLKECAGITKHIREDHMYISVHTNIYTHVHRQEVCKGTVVLFHFYTQEVECDRGVLRLDEAAAENLFCVGGTF